MPPQQNVSMHCLLVIFFKKLQFCCNFKLRHGYHPKKVQPQAIFLNLVQK